MKRSMNHAIRVPAAWRGACCLGSFALACMLSLFSTHEAVAQEQDAAPPTAPPTITCAQALALTGNLSVLTFGDFALNNSDTEGPIAVGGDAQLTNFRINVTSKESIAAILGGTYHLSDGEFVGGIASSGTGTSVRVTSQPFTGVDPLPVLDTVNVLSVLSADLTTRAINGQSTLASWGGLSLTGSNISLNVFTLAGADLARANTISIAVPAQSIVLINVTGDAASITNKGFQLNATSKRDILWNFPTATAITLSGVGFPGSILAPLATLQFDNGNLDGTLIAKSSRGSGEFHFFPFEGSLCEDGSSTSTEEASPDSNSNLRVATSNAIATSAATAISGPTATIFQLCGDTSYKVDLVGVPFTTTSSQVSSVETEFQLFKAGTLVEHVSVITECHGPDEPCDVPHVPVPHNGNGLYTVTQNTANALFLTSAPTELDTTDVTTCRKSGTCLCSMPGAPSDGIWPMAFAAAFAALTLFRRQRTRPSLPRSRA